MSDNPSSYIHNVRAMFDKVDHQIDEISLRFTFKVSAQIVIDTPGPGNQYPPDTTYQATGRLRAGWEYSFDSPPSTVPANDQGHTDRDGTATIATLGAKIMGAGAFGTAYLWNSVGYGVLVHEGLGHHAIPRPWVQLVANDGQFYLDEARREVMSG